MGIIILNFKSLSSKKYSFLSFFYKKMLFSDNLTMEETLWSRVNSELKEHGFTQESLSVKCDMNYRRIKNLTGTGGFPRADEIVKIAKELKTTAEYLVTGKDPSMSQDEKYLLNAYNQLNSEGKKAALAAVRGMIPAYPLVQDGESTVTG